MPEWAPLKELAPFESFFRRRDGELEDERRRTAAERAAKFEQERAAALPDSAVRPFTRAWARYLDVSFAFSLFLLALVGLRQIGWASAGSTGFIQYVPIFLTLWHLLEAYLVSRYGTTPGKALTGIRITDAEGNNLSFRPALRRSLGVYVLGVGCYIGLIFAVAGGFGYYLLMKNRRSFWDVSAESYVEHEPFHIRHILLPVAIFILIGFVVQEPVAEIQAEGMKALNEFRGGFGASEQTL